jgi:uncharacterized membrane-anchored protein YjiN (DUF445 family)
MNAKPSREANKTLPILTEVVELRPYDRVELPETLSDVEWSELALTIRRKVTDRLLHESGLLTDTHLQDAIHHVITRTTDKLADDLRTVIAQVVRDNVNRALEEELSRLQGEIAARDHP